jgi:quercetin dioxygenase-like cupin family protein
MTLAWDASPAPAALQCGHGPSIHDAPEGGDMKSSIASVITAAAIVFGGSTLDVRAQGRAHILESPQDAHWGPAPPLLPAGAQIAVLSGDPTANAPYAIRLKFPANYAIPAHSHPADEHVVVVAGALSIGMGDTLAKEAAANKTLGVGGFALMPANMNHFAYTAAQETTIVLYGQGPVEFKYVNPSDDPRTAKKSTK